MSGMRGALILMAATLVIGVAVFIGVRQAGLGITGPRPDPKVASMLQSIPMFPYPGSEATLWFSVENAGDGVLEAGLEVAAYATDPRDGDPGPPVVTGRLEESLDPGARSRMTMLYPTPDETQAIELFFELDPDQRTRDSNRENNVLKGTFQLAYPYVKKPDLSLVEIRVEPATPTAGQDFTITAVVQNVGDAPTGIPVAIDLYVNDPIGPMPNLPGTRRLRAPPLAPEEVHEASARMRFDEPTLMGVKAQVDTDQELAERDETNNVRGPHVSSIATAGQQGKPDLVVESLSLEPWPAPPGKRPRLHIRVANRGSADTPNAFSVDMSYAPEKPIPGRPAGTQEPWSRDLRFLAAGSEFELPGIPVALNQAGAWKFSVFVDPYEEIEEGAENNNEKTLEIQLGSR